VKLIVGFEPGGNTDTVARIVAQKLSDRLGQQVVVENKLGAAGTIGTGEAARAAPDGYTLHLNGSQLWLLPFMRARVPYDPVRDFAFVTTVVAYPMFLLVAPNSPITSFQALIDRAKAAPGKVSYAIIGGGSVYHLLGKWIENRAGIEMVAVPYRGSVAAFTDVVGGRLDAMLDTATSAIPRIRNGQLRPLAMSSPERYPLMPDTPTMAETVPGIQLMSWLGLAAAAQTPRPIVDRLNGEVRRILELPDIKQWLADTGVLAAPSSPEELQRRVESEIELYTRIAEANGIKAE